MRPDTLDDVKELIEEIYGKYRIPISYEHSVFSIIWNMDIVLNRKIEIKDSYIDFIRVLKRFALMEGIAEFGMEKEDYDMEILNTILAFVVDLVVWDLDNIKI